MPKLILLQSPSGTRTIVEGEVFRFLPGEVVIGPIGSVKEDLHSIVTKDGLMLGNIVKRVTSALGIKQCMKCKNRQRRYNDKGLEIQERIKGIFQ